MWFSGSLPATFLNTARWRVFSSWTRDDPTEVLDSIAIVSPKLMDGCLSPVAFTTASKKFLAFDGAHWFPLSHFRLKHLYPEHPGHNSERAFCGSADKFLRNRKPRRRRFVRSFRTTRPAKCMFNNTSMLVSLSIIHTLKNQLRLDFYFLFFSQFVFLQAAVGLVGDSVSHLACL